MSAHLQGIDWKVWEICENANYIVVDTHNTQDQIDQHNTNSKARNVLFSSLSLSEFESLRLHDWSRDLDETLELSRGNRTGQNQTL